MAEKEQNSVLKCSWSGVFVCGILASILASSVDGLRCYQCSWSNNPEEYLKEATLKDAEVHFADGKAPDVKEETFKPDNPMAKPYIGAKVRHTPLLYDIDVECEKKECPTTDNACLKWSFRSNNPLNITYMCVTSKYTSGCFHEEVEMKTVKRHLKKEVCLCNKDLCNTSALVIVSPFTLLLTIFIICCYLK